MRTLSPIIVVGGGHAGIEAAHAAARLGADVLLLTLKRDALARLSCNPAIGGIGKGHLVREIDALGGVMGLAADLAGIHFRVLNRSRGPAVHGPRAQMDHDRYPDTIARLIAAQPRITIVEGEAAGFVVERGRLAGLETADGRVFPAAAAVVTTGTFLRGLLFRGEDVTPGGRVGEAPANALSASLGALGLALGRFKTGTPPRLLRDSLDFAGLERQPGDDVPRPFSFTHPAGRFVPPLPQTVTHLVHSNPRTHELVRANLHLSPLYAGRIRAKGPRYCPSFEDKVVRFADRDRHLLHLEPLGLEHPWIYVNGLSTSLPPEVQEELVHSVEGLGTARIARHGYAVEYDYVPPTQLAPTLETRALPGLFLAGQICGTTGYEEAAALGLVAGANAALRARDRPTWVPDRLGSYIGVMVDDLTTSGVLEPYRMFTSRAEARLSLSSDTADCRLTPQAATLGLVAPAQAARCRERWTAIEHARAGLEAGGGADRIRRGEEPGPILGPLPGLDEPDIETLVALVRYRGYLEREQREVSRLRELDAVRIPPAFRFRGTPGLSNEVCDRLEEVRPSSLGQASRIPGMTPAALALLAAAVGQRREAAS
ncbi:MAG: tRNA uridine-5-carboxymethylaminomethyl(34) synthesis enzyme MnmG [Acidobacteria bacterium]|nr:tRNA uridine-5-carboxymethylaminomethyl(34) synthesis enzyme MnmG [Acidobacteriota bacterium]